MESATVVKKGRGKREAVKSDKLECHVPNPRKSPKSTLWARHVYLIIKEMAPALLEKEEVIVAFNNFVDCLAKYDHILETHIPGKRMKYRQGIIYDTLTIKRYSDGTIPGEFKNADDIWRHPEIKEEHNRILEDIKQGYKPLYDLIKRDIVPKVEIELHTCKMNYSMPLIKKDIENLQTSLELENDRHNRTIKHLQESLYNKLEDLRVLTEDFKPTSFDDENQ